MQSKPRILLVDDEREITANLEPFLGRAGYHVVSAQDGEAALRRVEDFVPDLIVLDVHMPKMDGYEVCRQLRAKGNWTPIIILTQLEVEAGERARSLDEGADDYLNKPFDPSELAARIRAVLRRARPGVPPLVATRRLLFAPADAADALSSAAPHVTTTFSHFVLDRSARRVLMQNALEERATEVVLSRRAVDLLDYLVTHSGELLSRQRLMEAVWGWDSEAGSRAVDIRISELRTRLKDDPESPRYIATIPGKGYLFIGEVEPLS